jgi:hypothetical protein
MGIPANYSSVTVVSPKLNRRYRYVDQPRDTAMKEERRGIFQGETVVTV